MCEAGVWAQVAVMTFAVIGFSVTTALAIVSAALWKVNRMSPEQINQYLGKDEGPTNE